MIENLVKIVKVSNIGKFKLKNYFMDLLPFITLSSLSETDSSILFKLSYTVLKLKFLR